MIKSISKYVTSLDRIAPASNTSLHYNGELRQKTFIAGIITLLIAIMFLNMMIYNGLKMINLDEADIIIVEKAFDS